MSHVQKDKAKHRWKRFSETDSNGRTHVRRKCRRCGWVDNHPTIMPGCDEFVIFQVTES